VWDFKLKITRWAYLMQMVEMKTPKNFFNLSFLPMFYIENVAELWYTFQVLPSNGKLIK
jgi:hypothetical protein